MRLNYYRFPDGTPEEVLKAECGYDYDLDGNATLSDTVEGITVTEAKRLLKEHGGTAWTEHCERDGGVFEVTPIKLTGNNSRFKYNHHL